MALVEALLLIGIAVAEAMRADTAYDIFSLLTGALIGPAVAIWLGWHLGRSRGNLWRRSCCREVIRRARRSCSRVKRRQSSAVETPGSFCLAVVTRVAFDLRSVALTADFGNNPAAVLKGEKQRREISATVVKRIDLARKPPRLEISLFDLPGSV